MREKQVLIIPTDGRKPKNMIWSEVTERFKLSDDELSNLIETGEQSNGYCFDEALIYDNRIS